MRQQVGWYDPGSKRLCSFNTKAMKQRQHVSYTVPVYIDDETKDKLVIRSLEDVAERALKNQIAMMTALATVRSKLETEVLCEAIAQTRVMLGERDVEDNTD